MRRLLLRFSVALIAFLAGLVAAAAFAALFGAGSTGERARPSYAQPQRMYSCPSQRSSRELPEPPAPVRAPAATEQTRVIISGPGGEVRVVESRRAEEKRVRRP